MVMATSTTTLPLPSFFNQSRKKAGKVWRVPYQTRAAQAELWAQKYSIKPAVKDRFRICLVLVDCQNTFCLPDFELFAAGRSGNGAVENNILLSQFIYRNLHLIHEIDPTLDTHTAMQIFHSIFLVNSAGKHPAPMTCISLSDVENGVWKINPAVAHSLRCSYGALQKHLLHYARELSFEGRHQLMIYPYHGMLGGIGHALAAIVDEACFFHCLARGNQTKFEIKGTHPLIENYSVVRPEVLYGANGRPIAKKNTKLIKKWLKFDALVIAGQAKSHCVAWTVQDLLTEIMDRDPALAQKVYLLEDCMSSIVVPGVCDFTDAADATFQKFADAQMHVVRSTDPIESWPGISL